MATEASSSVPYGDAPDTNTPLPEVLHEEVFDNADTEEIISDPEVTIPGTWQHELHKVKTDIETIISSKDNMPDERKVSTLPPAAENELQRLHTHHTGE